MSIPFTFGRIGSLWCLLPETAPVLLRFRHAFGEGGSRPRDERERGSSGWTGDHREEASKSMGEEMREKSVVQDGMRIDWDVPIPMDDGVVLRADVFRPVAEGRYPVLLTYGPYGKGLSFQEGYPDQWRIMIESHPEVAQGTTNKYQNWEVVDPEKWVPDGYVVVRVDSRGAGRSPGVLDFFSPRETEDLYQCIEWAAVQPWSSGKVGLLGISYYAMNQWLVASRQPPHLVAMCPWEGSADFYRDATRHGGIMSDFWGNWFRTQVARVQHGVGERGARDPNTGYLVAGPETLSEEELARNRVDLAAEILRRPLDDAFYRERSPVWEKVRVPFLSAANWGGQGLHPRGNFEGFMQAKSEDKWLEVHGLEHWTHFYTDYGLRLQKRFFGYFLKGEDTGWREMPRVLLQVRRVDGSFVERGESEWPLARTRWTKVYLDPRGRRLTWEAPAEGSSVVYRGFSEGVTFWTEAFLEETEITGPVALRLYLASSTEDADVFATLRLMDPEGREVSFRGALDPHTPLAQGWLRASHRKLDPEKSLPWRPYHTHDEVWRLMPGEVVELDVEIWPTSVVVPPGYRLGLTVAGKDFERPDVEGYLGTVAHPMRGSGPFTHTHPEDRPPEIFDGDVTIYGGGSRLSYLLLPIVPPKD